jgi:hypothetical protein
VTAVTVLPNAKDETGLAAALTVTFGFNEEVIC